MCRRTDRPLVETVECCRFSHFLHCCVNFASYRETVWGRSERALHDGTAAGEVNKATCAGTCDGSVTSCLCTITAAQPQHQRSARRPHAWPAQLLSEHLHLSDVWKQSTCWTAMRLITAARKINVTPFKSSPAVSHVCDEWGKYRNLHYITLHFIWLRQHGP